MTDKLYRVGHYPSVIEKLMKDEEPIVINGVLNRARGRGLLFKESDDAPGLHVLNHEKFRKYYDAIDLKVQITAYQMGLQLFLLEVVE
jgi:hypothetical protein